MDEFFQIPSVPVFCNHLYNDRQAALNTKKAPITLASCPRCGFVCNTGFDPNLMDYDGEYENSLHFSQTFETYADELAQYLVRKYQIYNGHVVEVGCGQGDFLRKLQRLGHNRATGFDPSYRGDLISHNWQVFLEYFDSDKHIIDADLVCCRHVLEHLPDPQRFITRLFRAITNENCIIFFEVPNGMHVFSEMAVWDIIYEHCSYFSESSLAQLFFKAGFKINAISASYGRQFLNIEACKRTAKNTATISVEPLETELAGDFACAFARTFTSWKEQVKDLVSLGKRTVLWGAGSKGVSFLNLLNSSSNIEYLIDVNPRKWGKFIPGTAQKIVGPEFCNEYKPEAIILLNPIYTDEVTRMLDSMSVHAEIITKARKQFSLAGDM